MARNILGELTDLGLVADFGIVPSYGIQSDYGLTFGILPSSLTSTLESSAASFTAGGAGVTLTFTALDANSAVVVGYTPTVSAGTE